MLQEFLDDRQNIVEGADRGERSSMVKSSRAADGGEEERRRDGVERDAAAVQFAGELPVGGTGPAESPGQASVGGDQLPYIVVAAEGGGHCLARRAAASCSLSLTL
jgi:hypothetical protein